MGQSHHTVCCEAPTAVKASQVEALPVLWSVRCLQRMGEAEAEAARNSNLVHAVTYQEALAGIFKPPPSEHRADFAGLFLNCVVAGEAPHSVSQP